MCRKLALELARQIFALSRILVLTASCSEWWCHVWTAPFAQGLIWANIDRRRLRLFARPVYAVRLTAGPNEIDLPALGQNTNL